MYNYNWNFQMVEKSTQSVENCISFNENSM